MLFVMRVIFWLALVAIILPPRHDAEMDVRRETVSAVESTVSSALDFCLRRPLRCVDGATVSAGIMDIAPDITASLRRAAIVGTDTSAVPMPMPRPAGFARAL